MIGEPGVRGVAGTAAEAALSPKLVSAAHEFEAAMMKELLAPLEEGHDLPGGDGKESENGDAGSPSAIASFAGEALGKAISEHGGLGIAKSILQELAAKGNHSGNTSRSKNLNETPSNLPFGSLKRSESETMKEVWRVRNEHTERH